MEKEAVLQGRQGEQEPTSQSHRVNRASPWRRAAGRVLCVLEIQKATRSRERPQTSGKPQLFGDPTPRFPSLSNKEQA